MSSEQRGWTPVEVASACAMYFYNRSAAEYAEELFAGRHPDYLAEHVQTFLRGGFTAVMGRLDDDNRARLVDLALRRYGDQVRRDHAGVGALPSYDQQAESLLKANVALQARVAALEGREERALLARAHDLLSEVVEEKEARAVDDAWRERALALVAAVQNYGARSSWSKEASRG